MSRLHEQSLVRIAMIAGQPPATSAAIASDTGDEIYVSISGPATPQGDAVMIRQPWIAEPVRGDLPSEAIPPVLAQSGEPRISWVKSSLEIGTDGSIEACHPVEAKSTKKASQPYEPADPVLGPQVCEMLRERVRLKHAIDAAGLPIAVNVETRVLIQQGNARLPPAPPPAPTLGPGIQRTNGHVTDEAGHWVGWTWSMSDYSINPPDWNAALTDRRKLPKSATVGVMVDLRPRDGDYLVENCTIVRASGDARLDAATCNALAAAGYDQSRLRYSRPDGVSSFPVRVDWSRGKAAMTTLPAVEVPHMPEDVALSTNDLPPGERPSRQLVQIDLNLGSDAKALKCEVLASSGKDAWDAASCRLAMEGARFTSPLDWFGTPSPGTYELAVDWEKMVIRPRR